MIEVDEREAIATATAEIAAAYFSHNPVPVQDVGGVIAGIAAALSATGQPVPEEAAQIYRPAVPVAKSIARDGLISLIDGRSYKMLKRHLALHGLTPDEYRQRYSLRHDYPMVCADYSERRRQLAKDIGLGTRRAAKAARGRRAK